LPDDELADLLSEAGNRLRAARHLLAEKYYDDAVSRSYYSMYFRQWRYFSPGTFVLKRTRASLPALARSLLILELLNDTTGEP
jgi:hypothetical protein